MLFREQIGKPGGRVLGTDRELMETFREGLGSWGKAFRDGPRVGEGLEGWTRV